MPPAGVATIMDDDALIELEIAQQLQQLGEENNAINELQEEVNEDDIFNIDEVEVQLPPELDGYFLRLKQQTDNFERELLECDELLTHTGPSECNALVAVDDVNFLEKAALEAGLSVEDFKQKILQEVAEDDGPLEEDPLLVAGIGVSPDAGQGDGLALITVDESRHQFQKVLKEQMANLEKQHKEREERLNTGMEKQRMDEEEQIKYSENQRKQKREELEREVANIAAQQMVKEEMLEADEKRKSKLLKMELNVYRDNIEQLEIQTKLTLKQFEEEQKLQEERQRCKRHTAATKIQSFYKGYRARKEHGSELKEKYAEALVHLQEIRIERAEVRIQKRSEEIKKEKADEVKKQKEIEAQQKEEEDIKRKEVELKEKQNIEDLQKKKQQELKIKQEEDLKKKREEEEQIKQEQEEQRRKQEQEEQRRKKEEEKKRIQREAEEQELARKAEKLKIKEEKERLEREEQERRKEEEDDKQRKEQEEKQKHLKHEEDEIRIAKEKEELRKKEEELRKREEELKQREDEILGMKKLKDEQLKHQKEMKSTRLDLDQDNNQPQNSQKTDNNNITNGHALDKTTQDDEFHKKSKTEDDRQKRESSTSLTTLLKGLPDEYEQMRLKWIKECIPWSKVSNEPWKQKTGANKKQTRRPSSAKKLPPLANDMILMAARVSSLRKVTTLQLQDLPGCSISTLGQCVALKSVSLVNCNLLALDGLQTCKQLQYVDARKNFLEYIDLKDIGNLVYLNVSHNKLSSIHGLDGCVGLRWLDISHNRITRTGGMHTLNRLHTLDLNTNQLISTAGLSDTPTIQHLDLSQNHLQKCEDIAKLCLLEHLNLASNTLTELPLLHNHVLLQMLNVEDNSIENIDKLKAFWVPLLHSLNISQNGLESLVPLKMFHLLKDVDLSVNQILEPEVILQAIDGCQYLERISIEGNPALEEEFEIISKLKCALPRLNSVDATCVPSNSNSTVPQNGFEAMCLSQNQQLSELYNKFQQDRENASNQVSLDINSLNELIFKYCDVSNKVSVDFRYAHEFGDINVIARPTAPSTPKSATGRSRTPRKQHLTTTTDEVKYLSPKEMFEKSLLGENGAQNTQHSTVSTNANVVGRILQDQQKTDISIKKESLNLVNGTSGHEQQMFKSAVTIQAHWRGYHVRNLLSQGIIPGQSDHNMEGILTELNKAATIIQAHWRGYSLRARLERALDFAKFEEEDEDDFEFGEVDMDEFKFDEDALNDWKISDMPQMPNSYGVLGKPPSGKVKEKVPGLDFDNNHSPPSNPRKAWRGVDSPMSDAQHRGMSRPPSSLASGPLTGIDSHRSGMSKKEEKLSEEWGFKNEQTAHLMLQRAKKMKYNAERRKKLSKLDPRQKLALFRRLEEGTGVRSVKPINRNTLPRTEYFQAQQQAFEHNEREKRIEAGTKKDRTFEWLHTQVGEYDVSSSRIQQPPNQRQAFIGNETNLPALHPDITAGKPFRLFSSPVMDLQSVDSASNVGDQSRWRQLSTGSEASTKLPPIKTGSAPSVRSKEKMSWRNKDNVDKSGGWGGGKKRQK